MKIPDFTISNLPQILFGDGVRRKLPELAQGFGRNVLLVTGANSLRNSPAWPELLKGFEEHGLSRRHFIIDSEPSPQLADDGARQFRTHNIDVVIGIGGGSVLDGAKAIAGLLRIENSVMDFLEGVGPELPYRGPSVPMIAVPTTAGTGSEATKNAVLSVRNERGFKKSFRHEQLMPRYAVIDPEFLVSCPPGLIAADGIDAVAQLVESYVSIRANPFTDSLALSGINAARTSLLPWYSGTGDAAVYRRSMAYAALMSGIALAQAGLGAVHGLAAPLGAFFPIPHGVVCGAILTACCRGNIRALRKRNPSGPALEKYAELGRLLAGEPALDADAACDRLLEIFADWTGKLQMPKLSGYLMTEADIPHVVANCRGSSMKPNPIVLTDEEVAAILRECL